MKVKEIGNSMKIGYTEQIKRIDETIVLIEDKSKVHKRGRG